MLNIPIDLSDLVRLSMKDISEPAVFMLPSSTVRIDGLSDMRANLAYRAAVSFLSRFPLAQNPVIEIEKHIPAGGGLGGGSSDAAAVLLMLADLRGRTRSPGIRQSELRELAVDLGADVPYFLEAEPAHVSGIGERIERVSSSILDNLEVMLVLPPFGTSTPAMYEEFRRRHPLMSSFRTCDAEEAVPALPFKFEDLSDVVANDFNGIVSDLYPEIRCLLDELGSIDGLIASLSGSGSTVFVVSRLQRDLSSGQKEKVSEIAGMHGAMAVSAKCAVAARKHRECASG